MHFHFPRFAIWALLTLQGPYLSGQPIPGDAGQLTQEQLSPADHKSRAHTNPTPPLDSHVHLP
jgi:hypothetical protein